MTRRKPLLLTLLALAGCEMPETPGSEEAPARGVERISYRVPGKQLTVSALRKGDPAGQLVIFVHGTPGDADGWARFLFDPPPGSDYVAIDRPGFGKTRPDQAVTSLAEQAAAIAPLLQQRGGRWPILVGHSLGGPIVAQVALDYPGRVDSLLILAGSFDPGLEHVYNVQKMGEWPGIRAILPSALRNANRELIDLEPQLERLAPRLASLRCPAEVIQGTADKQVPYANVAFLRAHVPADRLRVTVIEGGNHFIPWERQPLVEEKLAGLRGRAPDQPC